MLAGFSGRFLSVAAYSVRVMLLTALAPERFDGRGFDDTVVGECLDAPVGSFVAWALELPPGPESLAMLCSLDAEALTAAERVLVLQAWERQHAWLSARLQAATVAVAGPEPVTADDWAQDEVAAALRLSSRSAQNRVHLARTLTEELPGLTKLLHAGEVSFRHALAAVELCAGLPHEAVAAVEKRVLPKAADQSIALFRRSLRRAVLAAAPEQAEEAAQEALANDVDVRLHPLPNGMAENRRHHARDRGGRAFPRRQHAGQSPARRRRWPPLTRADRPSPGGRVNRAGPRRVGRPNAAQNPRPPG